MITPTVTPSPQPPPPPLPGVADLLERRPASKPATPITTRNQRLGINAKLAGRDKKTGAEIPPELKEKLRKRNARNAFIARKYRLRDTARELLPDFTIRRCGRETIPQKQVEVWLGQESKHAHWKGLSTCGSVWVCPVCSVKISKKRQAEVSTAIERARENGWHAVMLTLTASHRREDTLVSNLNRSRIAKKSMKNWRGWRNVMKRLQKRGWIDAVEITWYFTAGWHVHFHIIIFFAEPVDPQHLENEIYPLWSKALDKQGMFCDREHGVQVSVADEKAAQYVTKWSLAQEITSRDKPGREGHYSPFQLLKLYEQGELWAGALFQEYADATKGAQAIRFSRGLRQELDIKKTTDQELAEATDQEKGARLAVFTRQQFKKLLYSGRKGVLGEVLMVAESGRAALLLWLKVEFEIDIPP